MSQSHVCSCGGTILLRKGKDKYCSCSFPDNNEYWECNYCAAKWDRHCVITEWDKFTGSITWERQPFSEGMCRYAHKATLKDGKTWKVLKQMVVKQFKDQPSYNKSDWEGDMKCHTKAIELITKWNELKLINKKYIMHKPTLVQITSSWSGSKYDEMKQDQWVLAEPYLDGKYEKWNSNSGWCKNPAMSIQAFCHWTYHQTNGELLMCDAQGVRGAENYFVTDPAIMSAIPGQYGCTDCGIEAIKQWFRLHKCNEFCSKNWIRPKDGGSNKFKIQKASTYRWQTEAK